MAPGETRSEAGPPRTLGCLDDIRDHLRRDHVFFLPEGRHLVLPQIVPGQSWSLSIGMRAGFLDLIIPMQRLHPTLAHGDIATLMLDVNAQLNLPGFYFDRGRRQVYYRLSLPWGQRGLDPAELRQWVAAVRQTVREHGPAFECIDGHAVEAVDDANEADEAATPGPSDDHPATGDVMRRLVQAAPSLRSQRQALKRWLGGGKPGAVPRGPAGPPELAAGVPGGGEPDPELPAPREQTSG